MARIRTPLSWGRRRAVPEDASFFDGAGAWRPRPDSPEVSVFSPEEEAESHARWRRAVLRERFTGPVSGAEKLGFGLSAAALAALVSLDGRSSEDEEVEASANEAGAAPAPDTVTARKPAAAGDAEKPAITTKPAGATHAFLDAGLENVFISPASTRADNGMAVRRAAPRGSGAPLEARAPSGTERADAGAGRKAETAPTEGRTASAVDGALAARAPADASAAAMAIAMDFYVPEARAEGQAQTKTAAVAAKAEGGRAPAEAQDGAMADVPPAAVKADAEQHRRAVPEAPRPEVVDDAPAAVQGKTAEGGRGGGATDAVARPKAKDAVAATATLDAEARGEEEAAEAPVEAKAKDVAAAVEGMAGPGNKAVNAPVRTETVEVEAVQAKSIGRDRSASEAPSQQFKAKDVAAVHEAKTEALRDPSAAPEQAMAKDTWAAADVGVGSAASGWSVSALGRTVANDAAVADKASGGQAKAGALVQQIKAVDASDAVPIVSKADHRSAQVPDAAHQLTPQQTKDAGAKVDLASGPATQSGQTKDVAAAVGTAVDGGRDLVGGAGLGKGVSGTVGAKVDAGFGDLAKVVTGQEKAKDAPTVGIGPGAARDVKDASAPTDAKAGVVQTVEQVRDAAGAASTKADPTAVDLASKTPDGLGKAADVQGVQSNADVKDGTGGAKSAAIPATADPLQTVGQAKEVSSNAGTKTAEGAGDLSKTPGGSSPAKNTPSGGSKEAPEQTASLPVVAKTEADGPQAPVELAGPIKETGVPAVGPSKADRGSIESVEAGKGEVKGADLPGQADIAAQPGTKAPAQNGGPDILGGPLVTPSMLDKPTVAIIDFWPGGKDNANPGETIVLPAPEAPLAVPPTVDLKGADGGQGKDMALVPPTTTDAPPRADGTPPPTGEGQVVAASDQPATNSVPTKPDVPATVGNNGDPAAAPPAQQVLLPKTPEVGPEQTTAIKPPAAPGDVGRDAVPPSPATTGMPNSDTLALEEVLNLFSPAPPETGPAKPGPVSAVPGSSPLLGPDAGPSLLEPHPNQMTQDLALL